MNEETNTEFKAVISAPSLKAVLKVIESVDDEAVLKVTPDGITTLVLDPARASMVDLALNGSAFAVYGAGCSEIGLDVAGLLKVLTVAEDHDMVSLDLSKDVLIVSFGYFRYELPLLKDLKPPKTHMPTLSWLATVKVSGDKFKRLVMAAEVVSDHAHIGVEANGSFFMKAESEDPEGWNCRRVSMDMAMSIPISKKVVSCYSLDYLHALAEVVPESGAVGMCIGNDLPLLVEFVCCDDGRVKYMLAPRIESD